MPEVSRLNPADDDLVRVYCEECGEQTTGLRRRGELPLPYQYGLFRIFQGACPICRGRRLGQRPPPGSPQLELTLRRAGRR